MADRDTTRQANLTTILRQLAWEGVETLHGVARVHHGSGYVGRHGPGNRMGSAQAGALDGRRPDTGESMQPLKLLSRRKGFGGCHTRVPLATSPS
jgi:hypothetical protein